MLVTNSEQLAQKVRKIGGHGFKNLQAAEGRVRLNADLFQNPDYKRHDVLGWNYRMPEFCAAVALAQLERVEELVELRRKSAELFMDVMNQSDFLVPQYTPSDRKNSYYTLGVLYSGEERHGVSWKEFRRRYIQMGGDGIYGAWSVPYLEPMIADGTFRNRVPELYSHVEYKPGLCPVAERIQKHLMQFKTNYRSIKLAEEKARILLELIRQVKGQ